MVYGGTAARRVTAATLLPWPGNAAQGYIPVGYQNAPGYPGSLSNGNSLTITSNTTYSYYNFTSAAIGANVVNVTFHGCLFTSSGGVSSMACDMSQGGNDNITFDYCSFAPTGLTEPGPAGGATLAQSYQWGINANVTGKLTVQYCDAWGFGNGMCNADGSTQAHPQVFRYNWLHDASLDAAWHGDGIGTPGGGNTAYVTLDRNNIQTSQDTQALAYQPSNQSADPAATYSNFTITNNLLGGYGNTVCVLNGWLTGINTGQAAPSNITFTGNTFSTLLKCVFSPLYDSTFVSQPHWYWRSNRWLVPPGAFWGHSQYNGYYWLPASVDLSSSGYGSDEQSLGLVSTTDYAG